MNRAWLVFALFNFQGPCPGHPRRFYKLPSDPRTVKQNLWFQPYTSNAAERVRWTENETGYATPCVTSWGSVHTRTRSSRWTKLRARRLRISSSRRWGDGRSIGLVDHQDDGSDEVRNTLPYRFISTSHNICSTKPDRVHYRMIRISDWTSLR
jgi:hypothetical protein